MNNLPEIRDIQIPDGVSFFPVAYGWWVILAAGVFAFMIIKIILKLRRISKRRYAFKELEEISTSRPVYAAVMISELLRRICILKYPGGKLILRGKMVDFLNQHTSSPLSSQAAKLLKFAPFMNGSENNRTYVPQDAESLKDFCRKWIGENL